MWRDVGKVDPYFYIPVSLLVGAALPRTALPRPALSPLLRPALLCPACLLHSAPHGRTAAGWASNDAPGNFWEG